MSDKQHTLKQSVSFTGVGLHTGEAAEMTILPAKENINPDVLCPNGADPDETDMHEAFVALRVCRQLSVAVSVTKRAYRSLVDSVEDSFKYEKFFESRLCSLAKISVPYSGENMEVMKPCRGPEEPAKNKITLLRLYMELNSLFLNDEAG